MLGFIRDIKNQQFMRLWWAQLISQFGDRLNQMALIGLIAEREPGSALSLAKLFAFTIIPVFIIGPIAGVYVDRWDKRRTLFVCDLIRAALVATIPFVFLEWQSRVPLYIVVFLIFCFSRFYVPAKMSIIPEVVPSENILMANSLMTTTGMLAFVLGCSLGGILVDHVGARGGFIGNMITYAVSALLVISMRTDFKIYLDKDKILERGREMIRIEKSFWAEIREGFKYLVTHKEISFVINMFFILLSAAGAIYVVIIVFIQQSFGSITKDLGVLAVFLGIGLFLGALIYGRWGKAVAWYRTIFLSLLSGGIMITVFAVSVQNHPSLILSSGLALILGVVIGPIFIAANTIIQITSDETMRGKVFSALEMVIHFAFLASMLISSRLAEVVPSFYILVAVGCLFAAIGLGGMIIYRRGGNLTRHV